MTPRPDDRRVVAESLRTAVDTVLRWSTRGRHRAASGLSSTDVWLLDRLSTQGAARMSDLAAWQDVDRSTMTVQIARLVKRGLVERTHVPGDRRAVAVGLTERGRATLAMHLAEATSLLDAAVADWSDEDLAVFGSQLARFAASLERAIDARD
ncbi:MarR family winged helix-turn-helix transcriptional regulator [Propionibacteriaceae bacterium G1746]|uniref:MarR family winged helix-turn-helix transcriptional regulator n=1 Tax=Aestuariimicrobium sp. G57 TaxID=3418485 RepID=UPI003C254297